MPSPSEMTHWFLPKWAILVRGPKWTIFTNFAPLIDMRAKELRGEKTGRSAPFQMTNSFFIFTAQKLVKMAEIDSTSIARGVARIVRTSEKING